MNISSHEEYGLRCALQLAREFGMGPISASKIAEREGISVEYVSKFMHLFRKQGYVLSLRGTQGGFQLSKEPSTISLHELLCSLGVKQSFCEKFTGQKNVCVHIDACSIRPVWSLVTYYFDSVLRQLSLKDLLDSEDQVREKIESALLECIESRPMERKQGVSL